MNETQIQKALSKKIMCTLGSQAYVTHIQQESGQSSFQVMVGFSKPKIIYDDSQKKQYIKFLKFNDITKLSLKITPDGSIEFETKPEFLQIKKRTIAREKRLRFATEQVILDELYPKLIKISLIKDNLRPIYTILNHIFSKKCFNSQDLILFPANRRKRIKKYLHFLSELQILREDNSVFREGNIPIEIKSALENKDEEQVLAYTFGFVIKDGRKYLRDVMNLRSFDSFINIITSYYFLSSQVGNLLHLSEDSIKKELELTLMKKINSSRLLSYLEDLREAGIIKKENSFFVGETDVFSKVINA